MCPVKVARKLYHGAFHHCRDGAHPIPEMRPLWLSVDGQFVSKRAATLTSESPVTCADSRSARDSHLSAATDVAAKVTKELRLMEVRENLYQNMEVAVGPERAMECEQQFEQVLEENVAEMDIGELKHEDVKALVQKGMLEAVQETKVKFVLCAEWNGQTPHQEERHNVVWSSLVSICDGREPRGKSSTVVGVKLGKW